MLALGTSCGDGRAHRHCQSISSTGSTSCKSHGFVGKRNWNLVCTHPARPQLVCEAEAGVEMSLC